jgi:hypothetical protein
MHQITSFKRLSTWSPSQSTQTGLVPISTGIYVTAAWSPCGVQASMLKLSDSTQTVLGLVRATMHEAQSRCLSYTFPFMFFSLPNIFRKESRYFLQYLNKFPFMVIVSNFEEITPLPTNLKVPNLQSDFSVSNSVRSNFLNKHPNKILISTMSFILQN